MLKRHLRSAGGAARRLSKERRDAQQARSIRSRDIADYVDAKLHEMEDRLGTKIAAGFRDQADLYRSGFVDGDPAMHRHARDHDESG